MNQPTLFTVISFALVLLLAGCSGKSPVEGADQAAPAVQEQAPEPPAAAPTAAAVEPEAAQPTEPQQSAAVAASQQPAPATASPAPAPQPKAEAPAATPPAAKPATAVQPAPAEIPKSTAPVAAAPPEPAAAEPKPRVAKDVVVLTGSPLGGVRLQHKLHGARAGNDCSKCHHASKPEKAASAPQQACSECHTRVATPPMKTIYQGAFHNPMAQAGTCIDCHKAENAKGKKAPLTCMECHKQENK